MGIVLVETIMRLHVTMLILFVLTVNVVPHSRPLFAIIKKNDSGKHIEKYEDETQ